MQPDDASCPPQVHLKTVVDSILEKELLGREDSLTYSKSSLALPFENGGAYGNLGLGRAYGSSGLGDYGNFGLGDYGNFGLGGAYGSSRLGDYGNFGLGGAYGSSRLGGGFRAGI